MALSIIKAGTRRVRSRERVSGDWRPHVGANFAPRFSADRHVGTALRETFRTFARSVAQNMSELGLSLNMWFVLRSLWDADGLTQVDLASRLEVSPAAMVGIVNALHKLGFVARKRSKTDRRAYCIHLTPSGRALRTKATARALQVDAKALRGLKVSEVETLLALMNRLRANLAE